MTRTYNKSLSSDSFFVLMGQSLIRRLWGRGKTLCMTALSLPLSQGFSTFHDINVFRCDVAEFLDNLAGYKRVIC